MFSGRFNNNNALEIHLQKNDDHYFIVKCNAVKPKTYNFYMN